MKFKFEFLGLMQALSKPWHIDKDYGVGGGFSRSGQDRDQPAGRGETQAV